MSIALTNVCDLHCRFCYAPKNRLRLSMEYIREVATLVEGLGTQELTLGGGEPLLYPGLIDLCQWIWLNTALGISITTHGHHLTESMCDALAPHVSSLRFSVDGGPERYESIRGRRLEELTPKVELACRKTTVGINCVISSGFVQCAQSVIDYALLVGAHNVLLIPELDQGRQVLDQDDWRVLRRTIEQNESRIPLAISALSSSPVSDLILPTESASDFLFAHVAADMVLKATSHDQNGIPVRDLSLLPHALERLWGNVWRATL